MRRIAPSLVVVVLVALLPACAGGTTGDEPATPTAETAPAEGAFPRAVSHAMGETTIPAPPERVVVLDTGELDSVTALGITPVGAVRAPVEDGLLDYLEDQTRGTELVGTISEPDLEAIARLAPDLILSSRLRHEAIYDQLSGIAPAVFTETVGVVWKENFLLHAEALGMEERAREMLDAYEERAARLGERIEAELGELPTVSVVRFLPDQIRLYQKASFIGTVLADAGLPRPPSQDVEDFALVVGPEQVELMDADVVFYTSYGPPEETPQPEVIGSRLWENLAAVRAGRVYRVPDDVWMLGIGIQAANLLLDELERYLLEEAGQLSAFPVTIPHKYGETTIGSPPERVVSLGFSEQDFLLALGVVPVAVREWYGGHPYATWPWAQGALGDAQPEVLGFELDFELIASLEPDLIAGVTSGMTQDEYETLSQIAPTLAQPAAYVDYGTPWREITRILGKAVGESARAEELIAGLEDRFAAIRAAHPEFEGATAAVAFAFTEQPGVYSSQDVRSRLLAELGFRIPEAYDRLAGDSFYVTFSEERMPELLDVDVIVWIATSEEGLEEIRNLPLRPNLPAVQEGREVFLPPLLGGAFSFSSPLSIPFLLEDLVPMLAAAIDGDPTTEVPVP